MSCGNCDNTICTMNNYRSERKGNGGGYRGGGAVEGYRGGGVVEGDIEGWSGGGIYRGGGRGERGRMKEGNIVVYIVVIIHYLLVMCDGLWGGVAGV